MTDKEALDIAMQVLVKLVDVYGNDFFDEQFEWSPKEAGTLAAAAILAKRKGDT